LDGLWKENVWREGGSDGDAREAGARDGRMGGARVWIEHRGGTSWCVLNVYAEWSVRRWSSGRGRTRGGGGVHRGRALAAVDDDDDDDDDEADSLSMLH